MFLDLLRDGVELVVVQVLGHDVSQHILGRNMQYRDVAALDQLTEKEKTKSYVLGSRAEHGVGC